MIVEIPKSNKEDQTNGCWWRWGTSIVVSCPDCYELTDISSQQIEANGIVVPALECPSGCGFHRHIKLLEYSPHAGA